nr:MAG TPA: hypothetical protein [Caudoviricetes sp.]
MAILLHVPLNITSEKKNHSILPNKKGSSNEGPFCHKSRSETFLKLIDFIKL